MSKPNSPGSPSIRFRPAQNRRGNEMLKLSPACLALALVPTGCDEAVGSEPPNQGHAYIVGIDISGSRTPAELDESRKLLDGLIDRLEAGDRLALIEVDQGRRERGR